MLYENENHLLNIININTLANLNFNFSIHDRFVYVKDNNGKYFECKTPFLKILKPIHTTLNKKKTIAKKYLILETNDELDFNNEIGEFMFIINKIHELSQEKIKEKSIEWFNTEFDEIGLDIKVKKPIDQQKDSEFIRISIPKNNEIENEIANMTKGTYVLCNLIFKGLKVSSDYIVEEWEVNNIITQDKFEENEKNELLSNSIVDVDTYNSLIEDQILELNSNIQENNIIENSNIEISNIENLNKEDINENNNVENNNVENNYENTTLENEIIDNTNISVLTDLENIKNNKLNKKNKKELLSKELKIKENKIKKQEIKQTIDLVKKFSKKIIFT